MDKVIEKKLTGLYVMGENPAMSDPDLNHARKALSTLNHMVVQDIFLTETFNKVSENSAESRSYLNSDYNLTTYVRGFQNIPDLGFGRSEARLSISLNPFKNGSTDDKLIDELSNTEKNVFLLNLRNSSNNIFNS